MPVKLSDMPTITEAAARLGVSRVRVFQLVKAGRLKAKRLGPIWVISEASLKAHRKLKGGRPKGSLP